MIDPNKLDSELFAEYVTFVAYHHTGGFPFKFSGPDHNTSFSDYSPDQFAQVATNIANSVSYPQKRDFTVFHVYKGGKVIATELSHEEVTEYHNGSYVIEKVEDNDEYIRARNNYNQIVAKSNEWFQYALKSHHGVQHHPKAGKVYQMAWDDGHSSGYDSVANSFDELVELIKD